MRVPLRYGRTGLEVEIPDRNLMAVLRMNPVPPLEDPLKAVEASLDNPLCSPPLSQLARRRKNAVVVVSDVTRPVPNKILLPPILQKLEFSGIPREAITLLIATGLHRPNEGGELVEMLGEEIVKNYQIINHNGRDDNSHEYLGETQRGTPIFLDRTFTSADLKILTGLIEPHLMAGYSGGRKLVAPGIASWRTISYLHGPAFLEDPRCTCGILQGNPLHQELVEIARRAGVDFIVNVTLDEPRRVTGVFAGDLEVAHEAGVRLVNQIAQVRIPEPADIVVTSSAGYPLDTTFYQAVKGLTGALPAVKPGGTLILVASLSEGIGGPEFRQQLFAIDSLTHWMEDLRREKVARVIDQWQIEELGIASRKAEIFVYSQSLSSQELARCHIQPISTVEEGIERALRKHGQEAKIIAIPEGPYVLPVCGPPS